MALPSTHTSPATLSKTTGLSNSVKVGRTPDCALRVASNDGHPFSRFTCPSLTTASHDYESVSNQSVETLFELIESGGRFDTRRERFFPARLILRDSA